MADGLAAVSIEGGVFVNTIFAGAGISRKKMNSKD